LIHAALVYLKHYPVNRAKATLGYWGYRRVVRAKEPQAIDLSIKCGMGALICHALRLHDWLEANRVQANVCCRSPLYSSGEDAWAEFFVKPADQPGAVQIGEFTAERLVRIAAPRHLSLARAETLMARYFQPRPALEDAVDRACDGDRAFDLSVHFRGTDKHLVSGRIEHERMIEAMRPHIGRRVFLATDEPGFARLARETWPGVEFVSYDLGQVPEGRPRHFAALEPRDKALEALVNIYLLAAAPVCVRTSSYLSAVSKVANPRLRTVTINRTRSLVAMFPEDEIWRNEHP
jgi:hypothetical protein